MPNILTIAPYLFITPIFLQFKPINTQCSGSPKVIDVGYKAESLKFPDTGEYGTNLNCEWLLTSSVSGTILYKSTDIQIDCSDSYNIYDGTSSSSPAKQQNVCTTGSAVNHPLDRSSGQNLFLTFISDGTANPGQDKGFTIEFVSSPDLSSCSSSGSSTALTASNTTQAFTSPLFPNTYPRNHACNWTISPSTSGATVTLSLYYIDIDIYTGTCFDKLTIYYGASQSQTDEVCGNENFSPTNSYTNGGSGDITVSFTSDGTQEESGFVAVYTETDTTTAITTTATTASSEASTGQTEITTTQTDTTAFSTLANSTLTESSSVMTTDITSTEPSSSSSSSSSLTTASSSLTGSSSLLTSVNTNPTSSSAASSGLSGGAVAAIVIVCLAGIGGVAAVAAVEVKTQKISSMIRKIKIRPDDSNKLVDRGNNKELSEKRTEEISNTENETLQAKSNANGALPQATHIGITETS